MADIESWLRLLYIPQLSIARRVQLIRCFKTAEKVFQQPPSDIARAIPSISLSLAHQITSYNCHSQVVKQIQFMKKNSVSLLPFCDPQYPALLQTIPFAPVILFYRGILPDFKHSLAVIGSRKPLGYSITACQTLLADLSGKINIPIVSGLATGIDAVAHREALEHKMPAAGVLAFGFDRFYPASNSSLARKIEDSDGVLLTEYPAYTPLTRNNFLERNRIIAGLSKGTLIIQAAIKSGSMKTAFMALDYNREVFVVPYRMDSPWYNGSHLLIRQGAVLCCSAKDILREWDISYEETLQETAVELSSFEKKTYDAIAGGNHSLENLLNSLDCDLTELSEALISMEINGLIRKDISGMYSLANRNQSLH